VLPQDRSLRFQHRSFHRRHLPKSEKAKREEEKRRETERERGRQRYRQTGRQTDRQTDRETSKDFIEKKPLSSSHLDPFVFDGIIDFISEEGQR
jgi:hypothetical protein